MRVRTVCALLLAAALTGCVTETKPLPEPEPRLSADTTARLKAVLAEERTVLADDIVVRLTHDPFFTWSTFNGTPENTGEAGSVVMPDQVVVRREEGGAPESKLTVTLERSSTAPTTEDTLARATIGEGLVLLATRRIVLHYDLRPTPDRPAHVSVHGAGKAVLFKARGEPRKQTGTEVKIDVDLIPTGEDFRVDASEEVLP